MFYLWTRLPRSQKSSSLFFRYSIQYPSISFLLAFAFEENIIWEWKNIWPTFLHANLSEQIYYIPTISIDINGNLYVCKRMRKFLYFFSRESSQLVNYFTQLNENEYRFTWLHFISFHFTIVSIDFQCAVLTGKWAFFLKSMAFLRYDAMQCSIHLQSYHPYLTAHIFLIFWILHSISISISIWLLT